MEVGPGGGAPHSRRPPPVRTGSPSVDTDLVSSVTTYPSVEGEHHAIAEGWEATGTKKERVPDRLIVYPVNQAFTSMSETSFG